MTLEDVLRELGLPYRLPGQHENVGRAYLGIDCPRCSPGWGHFRLGVNMTTLYSRCWVCRRIPLTPALCEASGKDYRTVRTLVDSIPQVRGFPRPGQDRGSDGRITRIPAGVGPLRAAHKRYLEGRGFDPEDVVGTWDVRGIANHPRLGWRLFIPILLGGKLVSWTTRAIADAGGRYRSAGEEEESVPHKTLLYGEDKVLGPAVVVVEGPLDVWAVGPGAVCTFGVAFTPGQLARLARYPARVVCFDAEPDGRRAAEEACAQLSLLPGETYRAEFTTGKDAASADPEEVHELRRRFLR